jgi:hypothetical protein
MHSAPPRGAKLSLQTFQLLSSHFRGLDQASTDLPRNSTCIPLTFRATAHGSASTGTFKASFSDTPKEVSRFVIRILCIHPFIKQWQKVPAWVSAE